MERAHESYIKTLVDAHARKVQKLQAKLADGANGDEWKRQ